MPRILCRRLLRRVDERPQLDLGRVEVEAIICLRARVVEKESGVVRGAKCEEQPRAGL